MLGMSQSQLAEMADISRATLAEFELGKRIPTRNNLKALIRTLEDGGLVFIPPNEGGAGVRFKEPLE